MPNEILKAGDILSYYNHEDNPYHHRTLLAYGLIEVGAVIELAQWRYFWADPRVTHVSLIKGHVNKIPKDGQVAVELVDILKGKRASTRDLEHNYAYWVFRLKENKKIHSKFTPLDLAEKVAKVAEMFEDCPYNYSNLAWVLAYERSPDAQYLQSLVNRFEINFESGTFKVKKEDSLICAELIVLSYQIAWLLLAGKEAVSQPLPSFLNIHPLCTPSRVTQFFGESDYFDEIPDVKIHEMRYSGTPDSRDFLMPNYVNNRLIMKGYRDNQKLEEKVSVNLAYTFSM